MVVRQDGVDAIGDGLEQMFEELPGGLAIRPIHELGDRELAGPVNADKEIELALHRLNFGDTDMKDPPLVHVNMHCRAVDGETLEPLARRLVSRDVR